ncbi:family 20 glycosylhydrolase [Cellulomonas sp. Marseille-Q8402]
MTASDDLPAWAGLPQPNEVRLTGGPGWRPGSGTRILTPGADPGLAREGERLHGELDALALDGGEAHPGHVLLRLGEVPGHARAEGYRVDVADHVTVTGTDLAGVFRGTRQLLHNLAAHGVVPAGRALGSPAVVDRILHLDAARVPFSATWIERQLHELAYIGLNVLQLHFSENEGFRIESSTHPEVVSSHALTRAEVRRLLDVATDLHVRVDPSFSMPGHLGQVLRGLGSGCLPAADGTEVPGALDLTDEPAVRRALELVEEYATLFRPGATWNIGADEFVDLEDLEDHPALRAAAEERHGPGSTGFDLLVGFVNRVASVVRSHGFVPQVWNDGMFRSRVQLDQDVRIAWWTGWSPRMAPLAAALEGGHRVVNANDSLLYYVLGECAGYRYPTAQALSDQGWHPGRFADRRDGDGAHPQNLAPPYPEALAGTMFSVWGDVPDARTPEQVHADLRGPLRAMAERSANAGSLLRPQELAALDHAIGRAPATRAARAPRG